MAFLQQFAYTPPSWASGLSAPSSRIALGRLPTPIHAWSPPGLEGRQCFIKRDDFSGFDLSGNKVRKLEFLLAAALEAGCDSVVTIGGLQSNHCRASACAAKLLGLEPHVILRVRENAHEDPGLVGNLLLERAIGASVHLVTLAQYTQHGSEALTETLAAELRARGRKPYVIPVGGSNALGTWGYLEAVAELQEQQADLGAVSDIVVACGSGGTAAGLALGCQLAGLQCRIHAVGVCDDPAYFYKHIRSIADDLGVGAVLGGEPEEWLKVYQGKGLGYATSTEEELAYAMRVSRSTGVILDPVYTGKALYTLTRELASNPALLKGDRVLFWHTGGVLGMYGREDMLQGLMPVGQVRPLMSPSSKL